MVLGGLHIQLLALWLLLNIWFHGSRWSSYSTPDSLALAKHGFMVLGGLHIQLLTLWLLLAMVSWF